MTVERSSTSLVRFLGAEVAARKTGGKLVNIIRNGLGGEIAPDASSQRVGESAGAGNAVPASINIAEYEAALAHMQQNGAAPLAAKAMAVVMVDTAAAQGVNVMALLKTTGAREIALVSNAAYSYINQLRDLSSQLGGSETIDNNKSLRSRYLLS